jgi:alkanesulfonate monooxygenase SsuD/methylene tetrahydromethanopterin reductase-like flavin-dependent oxidoreductase (luciferase family)
MKVSAGFIFQNADDFLARAAGEPPPDGTSRHFVEEIRVGELAADLEFDGLWVVEHHFSAHGETPSPLQELSYFAGRSPKVNLGSCVLVLPWNDPVRLAEQISVLDNLVGPDRTLTIGIGRGAAQSEFDGFEVPLAQSTERFKENADIIRRLLLETDVSYEGKFRQFKNLTILPRPRTRVDELLDRIYCAWGSQSSLEYAAEAGFRPLFNPKGSPEEYAGEIRRFNEIRASNGLEPRRPITSVLVYAHSDPERAREEAMKYLRKWAEVQLLHYRLLDAEHFRAAGNYGDYARRAEEAAKLSHETLLDSFAKNQVFGTPAQCLAQIREFYDGVNPEEFVFVMRFGGMPLDIAESNVRLIAKEIAPVVRSWQRRPADASLAARA